MKPNNLEKKKREFIKKFAERTFIDDTHWADFIIEPLFTRETSELDDEEAKKYGQFKIERNEYVNHFYKELIERSVTDNLYLLIDDQWVHVLNHTIYGWEKEMEHGKEYEEKNKPLIP